MEVDYALLRTIHRILRQLNDLNDRLEKGPRQIAIAERAEEEARTRIETTLCDQRSIMMVAACRAAYPVLCFAGDLHLARWLHGERLALQHVVHGVIASCGELDTHHVADESAVAHAIVSTVAKLALCDEIEDERAADAAEHACLLDLKLARGRAVGLDAPTVAGACDLAAELWSVRGEKSVHVH